MTHGLHHDPVQIVNDNHGDDLLAVARAFCGHPDATSARAERIDGAGVDLMVDTPRGPAEARVSFAAPVADDDPDGLRTVFADLARRARAALADDRTESSAP